LEILRLAGGMTRKRAEHPAFSSDDRQMLSAIASHCDLLEMHWGRIERFCARIPRTLVHGDLSPWNARIRATGSRQRLLIVDWESAGWGVPAADLAQFAGHALTPDIAAYWSVARGLWPSLELSGFRRLADLGTLFRWINAVAWANSGFRESAVELSAEWFTTEIRCYQPDLDEWVKGTECLLELA
jgi:aminoglycoside phosphotransferase (APT) family kinase protein